MLSVKQGGIKYHILSLWYDLTWIEPRSPGPLANILTKKNPDQRPGLMIIKFKNIFSAKLWNKKQKN